MSNRVNNRKSVSKRAHFGARVLVVGIIFSITSLLIAVDSFKEYKGTVSVIVVPKSEIISLQLDKVVFNIGEFPKMLSFYERLIKFNPQVKDYFIGLSPDSRKQKWNNRIEVRGYETNEGSIITLSVFADKSAEAEMLSKKTATTLFDVVSAQYNIKTDLGINIVDGPVVSAVLRNWPLAIIVSLLIGFLASLILNIVLRFFEKVAFPGRNYSKVSPLAGLNEKLAKKEVLNNSFSPKEEMIREELYTFDKLDKTENISKAYDMNEQNVADEKEYFDKGVYPNFPEMPLSQSPKSSSAPDNLPIFDSMPIFEEPKRESNVVEEDEKESAPDFIEMKKGEPTELEIRERLNKLLKGDM